MEEKSMKRWMILLIVFALMGGWITLSGCTWEDVDAFMGSTYGCGCFWDCTKTCVGTAEEYSCVMTDTEGNCVDPYSACSANGLMFFVNCACNYCAESSDK